MLAGRLLAAVAVVFHGALPAMAQNAAKNGDSNGHHYLRGPKTEVPHHMGKKETGGNTTAGQSGGHHYSGAA